MSTRKGIVIWDQIIRETLLVIHERMKRNEEKYNNIEDPEMVDREVGPSRELRSRAWLPSEHVRLASMERKDPELIPLPPPSQIDTSSFASSQYAREIAILLGSYPDIVKTALKTHEPSGVVTFAFRLAHAISSAWETLIVEGEEDMEKARAKL
ncbi:hypothetical protein DFH29DRAFT_124271 [Suillus ampliporus]|nr:hypothetical protein DFH29DRAFT_124271 [Suillus ampliporus]